MKKKNPFRIFLVVIIGLHLIFTMPVGAVNTTVLRKNFSHAKEKVKRLASCLKNDSCSKKERIAAYASVGALITAIGVAAVLGKTIIYPRLSPSQYVKNIEAILKKAQDKFPPKSFEDEKVQMYRLTIQTSLELAKFNLQEYKESLYTFL